MSRSNYDKPFYVDVGTSVVTIRCASNCDVIMAYKYAKCPQVIQFAKDTCDMMNKEAEIGRPLRNCDVGTASEQIVRFRSQCKYHKMRPPHISACSDCPVNKQRRKTADSACTLIWSQMPYEEVKNGD